MIQEKILSQTLRSVFAGSMLVGMTAMMHNAMAQDAAPQKIESVQITGTRITTPGTTSTSPISSVSAEEIKASQPAAVEEFIKTLPVAMPSIGSGTNNGTSGAATIDLRGLGPNRTLVLINGRRMVPFNLDGTVDTNTIPIALLSRVDLLTGGASVAYGADAVAGVVNFNLKKNFSGFDATTSYGGTTNDHDAKKKRTDITMGANLDDGRGNVVLSIGKTNVDPLRQGARPYGVTSLSSTTGKPSGSNTTIPTGIAVTKGAGGTDTLSGNWQMDPASGKLVSPLVPYNTNPLNYYQTGLDRTQATSLASYKINDKVEAYAEVFYTNSKVSSTLAESGTFGNVFQVPIGNPFIPDPARQQICARAGITAANCVAGNTTLVPMTINRRFVEMGPRLNDFSNSTLQYTLGARGDLAFDWTYDVNWTRGKADQTQVRGNWGSLSKVGQALNYVGGTKCVSDTNGCVPLNVFGAAGSITPAMIGFINEGAILLQNVQQDVGSVSFAGDLGNKFVSPWAGQPITMAITAEERKVVAGTQSDAASQIQGEVLGTGAPTPDRSGHFRLRELAIESQVPLIKDKPFVRALNADLGYRETEFKSGDAASINYSSWKIGAEWEPVKTIRFRGMVQKATRAPNVNELFAPLVTGLSNQAVDPCQKGGSAVPSQANTPGTLANLCRLTGVPAGEIGSLAQPSSGQINRLSGGNPDLGPETAKTKTLGFVWEPLPKLAISLDYYKITIANAISRPSTTDITDDCYNNNPTYAFNASCAQIGRNPANGTFNGVDSKGVFTPLTNSGHQETSGFDLNVNYKLQAKQINLDPKYGNFDLGFAFNQVQSFEFQPSPISINRNCLGYYSVACGDVANSPVYKRKFSQRTTWNVGDFSVGYNWRYVSAVDIEPLALKNTAFLPQFSHIAAYNYVDLSGVYNYSKNLRFNVSVNNLANKKPPIVGGTIATTAMDSGNTFPQSYDAVGRYITFGASLKF
ncbi:outer membrane receptor protein involved in Fe transport [Duganella sp. SG902]|uniref:TonB-dependent receptor domain-containing protein n=1 Tax=Duganella sp. SG902 TaxID=2587016 RepID=UPI00159D0A35|nr:TonB-dependent receptor [Duganella sp. SG902]NVM76416.1 outer membrane receptor protein involved in Fe transport [Duganella sp. SG902]